MEENGEGDITITYMSKGDSLTPIVVRAPPFLQHFTGGLLNCKPEIFKLFLADLKENFCPLLADIIKIYGAFGERFSNPNII